MPRPLTRGLFLLLLTGAASFTASWTDGPTPERALITVRTLVIDALGTRTVDTDVARVPYGGTGLLIKKVPYGGPELSFRLAVSAAPPQDAGIGVTLSADIWSGDTSPIPPDNLLSHREEATVLAPDSSYLLEIDHSEQPDRRIMLSISARRSTESDLLTAAPPASTVTVTFDVEVVREANGVVDPLDTRSMSTMVGVAATYNSGMKIPGKSLKDPPRFVGLGISVTAERISGDLITLRSELTGADFVDPGRTQLVPIQLLDIRTVRSGARFDLNVNLTPPAAKGPATPSGEPAKPPVTYRVAITPRLR